MATSRNPNTSPLMFESDDENTLANSPYAGDECAEEVSENKMAVSTELPKEERILKGFQTVLMGIPPPPAFTVPQVDSREFLKLWRENQKYRFVLSPGKGKKEESDRLEEIAKSTKWPETLDIDQWDIYYNKNTVCEEMERLSMRYKERYVGAETSSCVNVLYVKSPARKRARSRLWGHSPGRRLSHLARRRKAFSSASLSLCSVAGNSNPDKRMILVEKKKIGNRQKKKNLSIKKTKPTPKKKEQAEAKTIKRALFQSPDQLLSGTKEIQTPNTQCVQRSKRNLFSDPSCEKLNENGKRERPIVRRISPRKRVNRTLSFQEGTPRSAEDSQAVLGPPQAVSVKQTSHTMLSGAHKQKMLWAATNALREAGMKSSHEVFRSSMSVLFKACQKLWLTRAVRIQREGSTSENMLALARQFSAYTVRHIGPHPTAVHMAAVCADIVKIGENTLGQSDTAQNGSENSRTIQDNCHDIIKESPRRSNRHIEKSNIEPLRSESFTESNNKLITPVSKSSPSKENVQSKFLSGIKESPRRSNRNVEKSNIESPQKRVFTESPKKLKALISMSSPSKQNVDKENIQSNFSPSKILSPMRNKSCDLRIKCLKNVSHQSPAKGIACDSELEQISKVTRSKSCDSKSVFTVVKENLSLQADGTEINGLVCIEQVNLQSSQDSAVDIRQIICKNNFEKSAQKCLINEMPVSNQIHTLTSGQVARRRSNELVEKSNHCNENIVEESDSESEKLQNTCNTSNKTKKTAHKRRKSISKRRKSKDLKDKTLEVPGFFLSPQKDLSNYSPAGATAPDVVTNSLCSEEVTTIASIADTSFISNKLGKKLCSTHENKLPVLPSAPLGRALRSNSKSSPLNNIPASVNNSVCFVSLLKLDLNKQCKEDMPTKIHNPLCSASKDCSLKLTVCSKQSEICTEMENHSASEKSKNEHSCNQKPNGKVDGKTNQKLQMLVNNDTDKVPERVENDTRHLLPTVNTPSSQKLPEDTSNRTLQLYRLSNSGGEQVVLAQPPTLVPHWEQECEADKTVDTPPSLRPHWDQENGFGSGTTSSLPESIMAHWQQMSSGGTASDKIMFDFEDTSYEINFPNNNEDSRASSICAPFEYPNVIDDSRTGFYTLHRKDSTESCEW